MFPNTAFEQRLSLSIGSVYVELAQRARWAQRWLAADCILVRAGRAGQAVVEVQKKATTRNAWTGSGVVAIRGVQLQNEKTAYHPRRRAEEEVMTRCSAYTYIYMRHLRQKDSSTRESTQPAVYRMACALHSSACQPTHLYHKYSTTISLTIGLTMTAQDTMRQRSFPL